MTQAPHITLTEAITALAFNDPVAASKIGEVIADRRWGADQQKILAQISAATSALCDAGFSEKIEAWGAICIADPGKEIVKN